ncbi:hypothetical protein M3Y94_00395400 [Aphelenchoides besseyi]|nr:hypothetical protein M3Y94_00395400 [Aphelenchoides besseyi]
MLQWLVRGSMRCAAGISEQQSSVGHIHQLPGEVEGIFIAFQASSQKLFQDKPEQTVYYELVGPGGSFVIIETETDNSSRTKTVIQKYMNKVGGFRIGNDLRKRFDEKLFVVINAQNEGKEVDAQQLEEVAIEFDCEELKTIYEDDEKKYELQFQFGTLSNAEKSFKSKGFNVETTEVRLIPQHAIPMSTRENEVVEKLYSLLDDVEEVKNIFDNRAED